jgi:hypothetical protein
MSHVSSRSKVFFYHKGGSMRPIHLFLLSVMALGSVLFNDVSATGAVFPADTLQMTCNVPGIGDGNVASVTAGNGTPGLSFPVIVTCPGDACGPNGPVQAGQYARWDFTFDYSAGGGSPRVALLQVAADVPIEATNPPASVVNVGDEILLNGNLNDFDSKWIRFSPATDPFQVSYYTPPNISPRIEGAAAKKGFFNAGKCRLAGAGSAFGSPAEPVAVGEDVEAGPCKFHKVKDGRGCVISITANPGNTCTIPIADDTLVLNDKPLSAGTKCAEVTLSFEGSCKYCYVTSAGALKCVTNTLVASCPK